MISEKDKIYYKLREEMDKMPYGMPLSKSGAEIRILKKMFSPEEAEIAVHLNVLPEPVQTIYKRVKKTNKDISMDELSAVLETLSVRGAILPGWKNHRTQRVYSLALLAIGIFEFQVDRMDKEFYEACEEYLTSTFKDEYVRYNNPQMRVVPIGKSINVEHNVATYDDMRETIRRIDGQYVVANCVCRQGQDLVEKPCCTTDIRETCIIFPEASWRYLEFGTGRPVTKEEVFEILDRAEEEGLVIQPSNSKTPMSVCCCCGDCCGALKIVKQLPKPAELFASNYRAQVDEALCKGCKVCVKRCPMDAVYVEAKMAHVDTDRCIGCGVCVPKCKKSAMGLVQKRRQSIPPDSMNKYFGGIMKKKMGYTGLAKTMIKYAAGKKI